MFVLVLQMPLIDFNASFMSSGTQLNLSKIVQKEGVDALAIHDKQTSLVAHVLILVGSCLVHDADRRHVI
jgi:hypothetical protein